jgi:hypothetical protein
MYPEVDFAASFESGGTATLSGDYAEINSVPKREANKVLSPFHTGVATALIFLPVVVGLGGGIGLIVLGLAFADTSSAVTAGCVLAGFAVGVLSILVLLRYQHFLSSHYLKCVATSAVGQRSNPLVPASDPDAFFLEILPRSSWDKLGPASDIGFFRIHREASELQFEGDAKRYRIPFSAVQSCEVEAIRLNSDQWGTDQYFATVLHVNTANGSREIPLHGKQLTFQKRRMPQRKAEAEALCAAIQEAVAS